VKTLLLDTLTWDLCLDRAGNIAVADDPYAQAQDASSAIRTFQGECYYDTSLGVPYFAQILGKFPSLALLKAKFSAAALTVPGVVKARCFISNFEDRQVNGQVEILNSKGVRSFVGF